MRRKIVKASIIIGLLLAVSLGVLVVSINPIIARLKPQLTSLISKAVGQPVTLGELSVSLFPSFAINVADVALEKAQQGEATIKQLSLRTGLIGLLKGNIAVDELIVEDASFTVMRRKDGSIALSGIELVRGKSSTQAATVAAAGQPPAPAASTIPPAPSQPGAAATAPAPGTAASHPPSAAVPSSAPASSGGEPATAAGEHATIAFHLNEARIKNLSLRWIDAAVTPEARIEFSDVNAEIKNIGGDEDGAVSLTGTLLGKSKGNVAVKGSINLARATLGIPKTDVTLDIKALDLDKVSQLLLSYRAGKSDVALSDTLALSLRVKIDEKGIMVTPDLDAKQASIAAGTAFKKSSGVPLALHAEAQPSLLGTVQASKLALTLGEIQLNAPFSFNPQTGTTAKVTADRFPLAELSRFLPLLSAYRLQGTVKPAVDVSVPPNGGAPLLRGAVEINDVSVFVPSGEPAAGAAQAGFEISRAQGKVLLEGDTVQLKPFAFSIAKQQFDLGAKIVNLKAPEVKAALQSPKVELGPLLSALKPGGVPALADSVLNQLQLVMSYSQSARNGTVALRLAPSTVIQAPLQGVDINASFALSGDNKFASADVRKSTIGIFGGSLGFDARIDNATAFSTNLQGDKLDLAQVSQIALAGSPITVRGTLQSLTGQFTGDTARVKETLRGNARMLAVKGEIEGFNLLRTVIDKVGALPGMGAALMSYIPPQYQGVVQAKGTQFDSLVINTGIADQAANISELTLTHPLYIVTGSGKVGFNGTLNIGAQLKLTPTMAAGMAEREPRLKYLLDQDGNLVIPVLIKKDGLVPIVLPDVSKLAENAARNTAKEAGKRALDKLAPKGKEALDKVAPGLGNALDSLFK